MTIKTREIKFKDGTSLVVFLGEDGDYYDEFGTKYPAWAWDKRYCGIYGIETGKFDPLWKEGCADHDKMMTLLKLGLADPSVTDASVLFAFQRAMASSFVNGLFRVVAAPVYGIIGGFGGYALAKIRKAIQ